MAIISAVCASFKAEVLRGVHDLAGDTLKVALYTSSAALGRETTAYTTANEIAGPGYMGGGIIVSVVAGYPSVDANGRGVCRLQDVVWPAATIRAAGLLLYNASKANRAIMALTFGVEQQSVARPFSIQFPSTTDPLIVIT